MMFGEQIRPGNRGGAGDFKWSDVSGDKDRENYLGHSINAPTGRWQKNKDVHWYSRDKDVPEDERAAEIRKIKEAEADALAVALGFAPSVKAGTESGEGSGPTATSPTSPAEDAEKEERRKRKAERRERKEEKRARKEQRRFERDSRRSRSRSPVRRDRDSEDRRHRDRRDRSFILGATILLATKVFGASSIDAFEQEWSWLILGIFGATAMVDLVIGLAMGYYTARHVPPGMNTLDRLGLWAAQTGVLTSIVSTGVLVLFAVPRQTHLWLALLVVNTGMYGNSLMSLLNGRLHLAFQAEMPFSIMLSTVQHPVATVPAAHLKPQQGPLLSPLNFPSPLPKPSFMGYASPPPTALLFTPPSKNVQDIV
ncbi:MMtag domain-containing protein [Mycena kentingensis (nom. inval.)]|nr:MMtag domain-containing protein [Mycena kentingensis (nom. inval.)]